MTIKTTPLDAATPGGPSFPTCALLFVLLFDIFPASEPANASPVPAPYEMGAYQTAAPAASIALSGNHAYIAATVAGIEVIDITDPTEPRLIGSLDTPGAASAIVVRGGTAYVGDGGAGLTIIDVREPTKPAILGRYNTDGFARGVAISGTTALVADGDEGMAVIDVAEPWSPRLLAKHLTSSPVHGVAASDDGKYAYLAQGAGGLAIVNISRPSAPSMTSRVATRSSASAVTMLGSHAYVADGSLGGLSVIDVSAPGRPGHLAAYLTYGRAVGITTSDHFALVANEAYGLHVFDVADPLRPNLVADLDSLDPVSGIAALGNIVALTTSRGAMFIDIGRPSLRLLGSTSAGPDHGAQGANADAGGRDMIKVRGNHAFATHVRGFFSYDISDPVSPRLRGRCDLRDYAGRFDLVGESAWVTTQSEYLRWVDLGDPEFPLFMGELPTREITRGELAWLNETRAVLTQDSGVVGLDLSDSRHPKVMSRAGRYGGRLAVSGDFAYVATYYDGFARIGILTIYSIQDPSNIQVVAEHREETPFMGITVREGHAFLARTGPDARWPGSVEILDIRNPGTPVSLGVYETRAWPRSPVVSGDLLFFLDGDTLTVLDVSDPKHPRFSRSISGFRFEGFALVGDYLYGNGINQVGSSKEIPFDVLAKMRRGLYVFDAGIPTRLSMAPHVGSGGSGVISLRGTPGRRVGLQSSGDLRSWVNWLAVALPEGSTNVPVRASGSIGSRFFRAVDP